ncbi:M56 family metallopeptidase [Roseovarius sp. 2305UL8-3]|uniref:M56 family metallopeptidase n=1 Tax=Roseovarius conchicola TaxID=3121636 RepID=UPI0035286F7B
MMAMQTVLDLFIYANILLVLAFGAWRLTQAVIARLGLQHDYRRQLTLLKAVLVLTLCSPLIAYFGTIISQTLYPNTPLTLHDMAIAAYLRGDIALPATEFEALLGTRDRVVNGVLNGTAPLAVLGLLVLGLGALYHLWRTIRSLMQVRQAIASGFLWRRTAHTDVLISDTVAVPFAARGLRRRYVVLPTHLLTHPSQFRMIIAHEFQHLRAGDVEWELAFEMLRPILYWNPAFYFWKRAFDGLRELSCDQQVMQTRRIDPHSYARCLLDYCERQISGPEPSALNVAFLRNTTNTSRRSLETRILAMYTKPKASGQSGLVLGGTILVLALSVSIAAASIRQPDDWSQDQLMLSTIINLERLDAITRGY